MVPNAYLNILLKQFNMMAVGASLACGYVVASYVFLRKPSLIHNCKLKTKFPRCVHISHRGGAGEAYENTMKAFHKAVSESGTEVTLLKNFIDWCLFS
jgi:hypothetical protein